MKIIKTINRQKIKDFHEILIECDGRYLSNPLYTESKVIIEFDPGNYIRFNELWDRIENLKIIEKNSFTFWNKIWNRIQVIFKIKL